jgi:flagellar P-ring protein precursor FlgI
MLGSRWILLLASAGYAAHGMDPPGAFAQETRLKELVALEGVRDNQLVGYGMVVGLAGTGDRLQTLFSTQSLANLLERMGVSVAPTAMRVANVASVMVVATLPPFAQPGTRIDTTVSSIGDASNLQGGLLVLTALRAADGQTYAVAQGPVVTGGFAAGRGGNSRTANHPTVGRMPMGAIVERTAPSKLERKEIKLQLHRADFTTAVRIAASVNAALANGGEAIAQAENGALVTVRLPAAYATRPADFVADLERLRVETDRPARVVVNERTGTIVMGKDVGIAPVAILHGGLTVEIQTQLAVSQPAPLAAGTTQVVPQTSVNVKEEKTRNVVLPRGATVEELVRALSTIGATARDIIAILQSLRSAGALDAEVEVI